MIYSDKTLSIITVLFPSLNSSLEGIAADVFFAGCKRHCHGCHNQELQTFIPPNNSIQQIIDLIHENDVKILTLMGGEPLDQPISDILELLQALYTECPQVRVNLYTGYELDEIDTRILAYIGSVKTGKYDDENLSEKGSFLASKNQKYFRKNADGKFDVVCP